MSGRKRTWEESDQLDGMEEPIASASLHGAITSLSPIKKGRNTSYFDGTIADESKKSCGVQQRSTTQVEYILQEWNYHQLEVSGEGVQ